MRIKNKPGGISYLFFIYVFLSLGFLVSHANATDVNVPGYATQDVVDPETPVSYEFLNNLHFEIYSNVSVDLNVRFNPILSSRQTKFNIENENPIGLNISSKRDLTSFGFSKITNKPEIDEILELNYHCIYNFRTNSSVDKILFQFQLSEELGLDPTKNYSLAFLTEEQDQWTLLETEKNEQSSESYLEGEMDDLEGNKDYYLSIYEIIPEESEPNYWLWILIGIFIAIGLVSLTIIMSKTEFLERIRQRTVSIDKGAHQLDIEEVLENENRDKIIDIILEKPGIHFNELLRKTELGAGNLLWHLEILETYKIIGKKVIGKFVAYFPYYDKNPISNLDLKLRKSKITLQLLELIEEEPGLYNKKLKKKFELSHSTIAYHMNKLVNLGLIQPKKDGRKKRYYPNFDSDYFNGKENMS